MDSPLVVSMSRVIALAFAIVTIKEFCQNGVHGWSDATIGIATVLALPVMNAIQKANSAEVVALSRVLNRANGHTRAIEFDDYRID